MISVVIPVLNESRTIGSCLFRLQEEIADHEIVVVDGGSLDGTLDIVKAFPDVIMGRFVKIQHPVRTSARRFLSHGLISQQVLNIGLVFLYHTGVSPSRLKRFYGYPYTILLSKVIKEL